LVVSTTVMNSLQARKRRVEPEQERNQQAHLVHPDHEEKQRDERHPADLAARFDRGPDAGDGDRLAGLWVKIDPGAPPNSRVVPANAGTHTP